MGNKIAILVAAGALLLAGVTAPAWAAPTSTTTPTPAPAAAPSVKPTQRPAEAKPAATETPELRRCLVAVKEGKELPECADLVKRALAETPAAVPGTPHFTG